MSTERELQPRFEIVQLLRNKKNSRTSPRVPRPFGSGLVQRLYFLDAAAQVSGLAHETFHRRVRTRKLGEEKGESIITISRLFGLIAIHGFGRRRVLSHRTL